LLGAIYQDLSGFFELDIHSLWADFSAKGQPKRSLLAPFTPRLLPSLPSGVSPNFPLWDGNSSSVRLQAEIDSPVGGMTVVRHLEGNVTPLVANISRSICAQLFTFFSPKQEKTTAKEEKAKERFLQYSPPSTLRKRRSGSRFIYSGRRSKEDHDQDQRSSEIKRRNSQETPEKEMTAKRTSKKMSIKRIRIGEINIFASYKGETWGNLEDFDFFHLKLHKLIYSNKTYSISRLLNRIKKDIIRDLLSQVSRNFGNIGNFLNYKFGVNNWRIPAAEEKESFNEQPDQEDEPDTSTEDRKGQTSSPQHEQASLASLSQSRRFRRKNLQRSDERANSLDDSKSGVAMLLGQQQPPQGQKKGKFSMLIKTLSKR